MTHLPVIERQSSFRIVIDVRKLGLTDDQFYLLCRDNPELRFELSAHGDLIIMAPTCTGTGWKESELNYRLTHWAKSDGEGICFGPATGFTLPNGARRSPDASWIHRSRWNALTWTQQNRQMAPICPDFVAELRSPTDLVAELQEKMEEYIQNGARLGWLLDPIDRQVYVYRPGQAIECHDNPDRIVAGDVLPGFEFNFQEIVEQTPL